MPRQQLSSMPSLMPNYDRADVAEMLLHNRKGKHKFRVSRNFALGKSGEYRVLNSFPAGRVYFLHFSAAAALNE